MAKVKIYIDPVGNTLNIWWDDPKKAAYSEEVNSSTSNDVVIKDVKGRPISLELIGVFPEELNLSRFLKKTFKTHKEPFILSTGR